MKIRAAKMGQGFTHCSGSATTHQRLVTESSIACELEDPVPKGTSVNQETRGAMILPTVAFYSRDPVTRLFGWKRCAYTPDLRFLPYYGTRSRKPEISDLGSFIRVRAFEELPAL
jgi:hypothetical protein